MAITKSAKKAARQNLRRKLKNIQKKTKIKDLIKEIRTFVSQKKIEEAKKRLSQVYKLLDKTAKMGLIKKNAAARKKARITKLINKIKS
jgi:small subunit ribosomal protein S20